MNNFFKGALFFYTSLQARAKKMVTFGLFYYNVLILLSSHIYIDCQAQLELQLQFQLTEKKRATFGPNYYVVFMLLSSQIYIGFD